MKINLACTRLSKINISILLCLMSFQVIFSGNSTVYAASSEIIEQCRQQLPANICNKLNTKRTSRVQVSADEPLPGYTNEIKWSYGGNFFVATSHASAFVFDRKGALLHKLVLGDKQIDNDYYVRAVDISVDEKKIVLAHQGGVISVWDAVSGSLKFLTKIGQMPTAICFMDKVDRYRSDKKEMARFKNREMAESMEQSRLITVAGINAKKDQEQQKKDVESQLTFIRWANDDKGNDSLGFSTELNVMNIRLNFYVTELMPLFGSVTKMPDGSYRLSGQLVAMERSGDVYNIDLNVLRNSKANRVMKADEDEIHAMLVRRENPKHEIAADALAEKDMFHILQAPAKGFTNVIVAQGGSLKEDYLDISLTFLPGEKAKKKGAKVVKRTIETGEPIWALAFSPDGRLLASGSQGGVIRLYDTKKWELINR